MADAEDTLTYDTPPAPPPDAPEPADDDAMEHDDVTDESKPKTPRLNKGAKKK
jgi:hypothetical protein